MIRINDPTTRHTIQRGLGCSSSPSAGANCSPDERFPVDNENYTVAFMTGVPICIPSTVVTGGQRSVGADANGFGDPFCPKWARQPDPIVDTIPDQYAYNLVPIVLGESLDAQGSFEIVDGVKFFSAHTIRAHARIMTKPGNPDYLIYALVEWDIAGFTNQRARFRIRGMTSLEDSQLDIYALHFDPTTNAPAEFPLASTVGNPKNILAGLAPFGGSLFKITLDVGFSGASRPLNSPCSNLAHAGFIGGDLLAGGCTIGATSDLAENFSILAPVSRDIIGRSRNKFINQIGPSKDILGNDTPNGQYLSPVTLDFPDELERSVQVKHPAFLFTGIPWNLDRRLGPLGCGKVAGDCAAGASVRLNPWPWDGGVDPGDDPFNPVG